MGYSNPKLDEILEMQQLTFDVKKREKLLWEAHKIILDDAPAVPLWNAMDIYAYRADLVWTAPPDEKVQLKDGLPASEIDLQRRRTLFESSLRQAVDAGQ